MFHYSVEFGERNMRLTLQTESTLFAQNVQTFRILYAPQINGMLCRGNTAVNINRK